MARLGQSDCWPRPEEGAVTGFVLGVLASFALFSAQASADERPAAVRDRALASQQKVLENKLTLIKRMLEGQSAQRVHAADNSAALEKLNAARVAYAEAVSAHDRQQIAKASYHAGEALRLGGQAIREVAHRSPDNGQWAERYKDVHERVRAYHQAYARVLSDNSRISSAAIPEDELNQLIVEAEKLARGGDYERAVTKLSALAARLEVELVRLRHQQTLIHELKFDTIEEEYVYERKRNRSYAMLLQMAIHEVEVRPAVSSQPTKTLQTNESERDRAESAARAGDPAQALKIIEAATNELVQALRKTGMYLP
ncbi:MAG: hypothetical protein JSW48_00980 [Betaproteobacteria bacterium]|jgi:hypothetical protein|nr:MAG: hypothetical protein JSW48_00980 [Betaproteobacteria bacterium]